MEVPNHVLEKRTSLRVTAFLRQLPTAKARQRRLARQRPRRQVALVVHAPAADRQVRIARNERDQHLLADARHMHAAQLVARPRAAHAHPAGAVLVVLAPAVPRELHLDAAQIVGPQVLAGRTDHFGNLRAVAVRLGLRQGRAQYFAHRVRGEVDLDGPELLAVSGNVPDLAGLVGAD